MERSFLSLHVGQAGAQIGHAMWELMCIEHNIRPDGALCSPTCFDSRAAYNAVFCQVADGSYLPRAVFVDTDSVTIDEIRSGQYKDLFVENQLISAGEDSGGNFLVGRHGFENNLIPLSIERIRWMLEMSDSSPTILALHSGGGGTGSGVTAACLLHLRQEVGSKLEMMEMTVMPSGRTMVSQNEILNSALYHRECSNVTSVSLTAHNGSLYDVCRNSLGIRAPTFAHINRLLATGLSNLTATERYPGSLPCNMSSISTNILPFANLKYPVLSCCPFLSCSSAVKAMSNVTSVTKGVFNRGSQFADVDPLSSRLMSCALIYRGNAGAFEVSNAIQSLKASNLLKFVDWCPIGFKVGIVDAPPISAPLSGMGNPSVSATMISNCTAIASVFHELAVSIESVMQRELFMHHYRSADAANGFKQNLVEAHSAFLTLAQMYSAESYSSNSEAQDKSISDNGEGLFYDVSDEQIINANSFDDPDYSDSSLRPLGRTNRGIFNLRSSSSCRCCRTNSRPALHACSSTASNNFDSKQTVNAGFGQKNLNNSDGRSININDNDEQENSDKENANLERMTERLMRKL